MKTRFLIIYLVFIQQLLVAQTFTEVPPASDFAGVSNGAVAFADVDNDGDQDVLITGLDEDTGAPTAKLYLNDGTGSYTLVENTPFTAVYFSTVAFADVDGDSDVLLTGTNNDSEGIAKLYTNDGGFPTSTTAPMISDVDFVVYPNPSPATQLNIRLKAHENSLATVQLFDLNGRRLLSKQLATTVDEQIFTLNITDLVPGVYFVEMLSSGKRKVARIIVH